MHESVFQGHLKIGFRNQGIWIEKFSDMAIGETKVFDFIACVKGRSWGIECKLESSKDVRNGNSTVVKISDMRRHQIENLLDHAEKGGRSWVAAGLYTSETSGDKNRDKRAWLIPIEIFLIKEVWKVSGLVDEGRVLELELSKGPSWQIPSQKTK